MVLDVVCNMEIDEKTAKWKSEYKEKTYYFCSPMCKQKFDRSPEKYVKQLDSTWKSKQRIIEALAESKVFKERVKCATALMEKVGLDAILLTKPQNMMYLVGDFQFYHRSIETI